MNTLSKYTRIKSGFSENRRIPRLGKIRLGLKAQKIRPDKSVVEYPTEVSYFVAPPEVQAVYGEQPTELDIMLPSDHNEAIFPQALAWFGHSKGLKCKGDGETAERLNDQTGQWEPRTCPCEHYKSKDNPRGECTENGILTFLLPKVSMGGTYQLRTGSYHSMVDVNSGLDHVRLVFGRIVMVPLKLRRVARTTHNDGKAQTHYTLMLTFDASMDAINQLRSDNTRILSHAQLQIEAPIEENPALDPVDITEVDAADLAEMDVQTMNDIQAKLKHARETANPVPPVTPRTLPVSVQPGPPIREESLAADQALVEQEEYDALRSQILRAPNMAAKVEIYNKAAMESTLSPAHMTDLQGVLREERKKLGK